MDTIMEYKDHIEEILKNYANRKPVNKPKLEYQIVTDLNRHQFILLVVGWHEHEYTHNWIFHLQLKGNKIWIHEDLTDPGIKVLLMEKGVPESDIILGFVPDFERKTSQETTI